jgi:adenine deaminase
VKSQTLAWTAVVALGAVAAAEQQARPFDLLITNARIVDGTGGPSITGSVAVRDGRIAGVGRVAGPAAPTPAARSSRRASSIRTRTPITRC